MLRVHKGRRMITLGVKLVISHQDVNRTKLDTEATAFAPLLSDVHTAVGLAGYRSL